MAMLSLCESVCFFRFFKIKSLLMLDGVGGRLFAGRWGFLVDCLPMSDDLCSFVSRKRKT